MNQTPLGDHKILISFSNTYSSQTIPLYRRLRMKRVFNQALSLFSPVKRMRRDEAEEMNQAPPKSALRRPRASLADVYAHLDAIERLQSRIYVIDKECLREQLELQREFDNKKTPLLSQRQQEIAKIPDFWYTAIGNHPFTNQEAWLKGDRDILSFLDSIDLDDNMDDNGSYAITFRFAGGNPYFSNAELIRTVTILNDQSDIVTNTPIMWAPKRKAPTHAKSFFNWFSSSGGLALEEDFGEVFRRDLWQNPYPYYLNLAPNQPGPPADGAIPVDLTAPMEDPEIVNQDSYLNYCLYVPL